MVNPTLLVEPIAKNGDRNTIPDTTTELGAASQSLGFPPVTGQPAAAGGVPPTRKDFNGLFNLLSQHNFFQQSGNLYEYDATLDYAVGAQIRYNGATYVCIQANGASSTVADPTDTDYWMPTAANFVYNTRDLVTSSGNYTAPVTGWYKVTVKGGGGGGAALGRNMNGFHGGSGGGEGGTTIKYLKITKGTIIPCVIGAGGTAATKTGVTGSTTTYTENSGGTGGTSSVTINGTTYSGAGGAGGAENLGRSGGIGDTFNGTPSNSVSSYSTLYNYMPPGAGAGQGAGCGVYILGAEEPKSNSGTGGGGAGRYNSVEQQAQAGAAGFVSFEYFDPSK